MLPSKTIVDTWFDVQIDLNIGANVHMHEFG